MKVRLVNRAQAPGWISEIALAAANAGTTDLPEEIADLFTLTHVGSEVANGEADVWIFDFSDDEEAAA